MVENTANVSWKGFFGFGLPSEFDFEFGDFFFFEFFEDDLRNTDWVTLNLLERIFLNVNLSEKNFLPPMGNIFFRRICHLWRVKKFFNVNLSQKKNFIENHKKIFLRG